MECFESPIHEITDINGNSVKISHETALQIYYFLDRNFHIQDVLGELEGLEEAYPDFNVNFVSDDLIERITSIYEDRLCDSDSWYDILSSIIDEHLEEILNDGKKL